MINKLSKEIYKNNIEKGFYEKEKNVGEMLCLIHSEVSEALEADRKGRYFEGAIQGVNGWTSDDDFVNSFNTHVKGTFEEEMADIAIRVMDMCGYKGIDLEEFIKCKLRFNKLRPHKHGKKY